MDPVDAIKLEHTLAILQQWKGLLVDTVKMFEIFARRTLEEEEMLTKQAGKLREYLTSEARDEEHSLTWRDRIRSFRHAPPQSELVTLACLYPGIRQPKPALFLSQRLKGFSRDKLRDSADWLAWATSLLECHALLSDNQRMAIVGHIQDHTEPIEMLTILTTALNRSDLPRLRRKGLRRLYRALTATESKELLQYALQMLGTGKLLGRKIGTDILEYLACLVPDGLVGLHGRLVDHRVFYPGYLFRGADADSRDRLLAALAGDADANHLLLCLAWIGDQEVQGRFAAWRNAPPGFSAAINVPPHEYALEAGWYLTANGHRKELCSGTCVELVTGDETDASTGPQPVRVVVPRNDKCGHCRNPLTTLLDLTLSDPRLAFLEMPGSRLRIPTCVTCNMAHARVFAEVDLQGHSRWSECSDEPARTSEYYAFRAERLVLGSVGRTPLEGHVDWCSGSWLGGYPIWLQDAEYPSCPRCREPMFFVGQVDMRIINADGMVYAFFCKECSMAATVFQCT